MFNLIFLINNKYYINKIEYFKITPSILNNFKIKNFFFFIKKSLKLSHFAVNNLVNKRFLFLIKNLIFIKNKHYNHTVLIFNYFFYKFLYNLIVLLYNTLINKQKILFISDKKTQEAHNINILNFIILKKKYYTLFKNYFNINFFFIIF